MPITLDQLRVLQIIGSTTATISTISSAGIVGLIVADWKRNTMKQTYYRIMFGLSVFDIILSIGVALATVPAPKGTFGAVFARGNIQTCTAQGFFIVIGYGAIHYTTSLALYYLLMIRFGKSREWIAEHVERYLHIVPITVAIIQALVGLPLKMYNFSGVTCWIDSSPKGCADNPGVPCQRGVEWLFAYRWIFAAAEVLASFLITSGCMIIIIWHVWRTERRMRVQKYDFGAADAPGVESSVRRKLKRTRQVSVQALLYISALLLTLIWRYIGGINEKITGDVPFPLYVIDRILRPLQGFFNLLIFLRGYKKKNRNQLEGRSSSRRLSSVVYHSMRSTARWITEKTASSKERSANRSSRSPRSANVSGVQNQQQMQEVEDEEKVAAAAAGKGGDDDNWTENEPITSQQQEEKNVLSDQ